MLIATSPRLSSDQEKNESPEDACPVEVICTSSKCKSGIIDGKSGDTQTYEDHSRHRPPSTAQSTHEYMADRITTEKPKELSHNQQTTGQSQVFCSTVESAEIQSDTHCYTKHTTNKGEELCCHVEHAEAPSEELDNSLQTAVQTDEFCNFLQTATDKSNFNTLTVQSEELHRSIQMSRIQSEVVRPLQSPATHSEQLTSNLQISTVKPDKLCNALKTETLQYKESNPLFYAATVYTEEPIKSLQTTVQSEKPLKSSHTITVQSEKPLKSFQTTVQSEELCSSIQMAEVLSQKPLDCLHPKTANSEGPCNSSWTATEQLEELHRPLESEKLFDFPNTTFSQSLDLDNLKEPETVQPREHYNLQQPAYIRFDDLYHREQAVPGHSDVLHQSMWPTTVQAECHHTTDTTGDQIDNTFNSKQRSSTQFAEPYYIKQASTVQSEEIYLSRTCDSHWSDSVTANKVAVEGDLNG